MLLSELSELYSDGVIEDVPHFLRVCTVLGELRKNLFGNSRFNLPQVLNYIYRADWRVLVEFVQDGLKYSRKLSSEFN